MIFVTAVGAAMAMSGSPANAAGAPTPPAPESTQCTISVKAVIGSGGDIGGNHTIIRCKNAKKVTLKVQVTIKGAVNETKTRNHSWSSLTGTREDQLPIALLATREIWATSTVCYDQPGFRKCRVRDSIIKA